jgi:hypothetical protein
MEVSNPVKAQILQMRFFADQFAKMQNICWRKCIANTNEVRGDVARHNGARFNHCAAPQHARREAFFSGSSASIVYCSPRPWHKLHCLTPRCLCRWCAVVVVMLTGGVERG